MTTIAKAILIAVALMAGHVLASDSGFKVLGFTIGAPGPETELGEHKMCARDLWAYADTDGVYRVDCLFAAGEEGMWKARLRARYGNGYNAGGGWWVWLVDDGRVGIYATGTNVVWVDMRFAANESDPARRILTAVLATLNMATASHARVIEEREGREDF